MNNFKKWLMEMARYSKEVLTNELGIEFRVENNLPEKLSILAYRNKAWIGEATFTQNERKVRSDNPNWDSVWSDTKDSLKPNQMWVTNLWVDQYYRRQGIATAMYEMAEEVSGNRIIRTPSTTPESDALWKNQDRNFG